MLAGPPDRAVAAPEAVRRLIGVRNFAVVWRNEENGLTFRVDDRSGGFHVKWSPRTSSMNLLREREKLEWAVQFTPVPRVLDAGEDTDGTWLVTQSIEADNAVTPHWRRDPRRATAALGRGLRALHEALPLASCPYSWSAVQRRNAVKANYGSGDLVAHEWSQVADERMRSSTWGDLSVIPPEDEVVCHGDACAPNTLLAPDASWIAHVDLGNLGVGDRWADLAVMSWSADWNYGPGWEMNIYDAYGIEPDFEKINYYRLLWELE